jgi:hypothetical protein
VRRPGGNDHDVSDGSFDRLLADGEADVPILDDERLLVRMPVQVRAAAGQIPAGEKDTLASCSWPLNVKAFSLAGSRLALITYSLRSLLIEDLPTFPDLTPSPASSILPGASLVRRPVGEVDDARAERPGIHELQGFLTFTVLEEALPAA